MLNIRKEMGVMPKVVKGKAKAPLPPVIRDADFARRLHTACDGSPHIPAYNHGRLTKIRDLFKERFKLKITTETVRKWSAGESRPRPDKMAMLAQILEVDLSWLSLGVAPDMEPRARQKRNVAIGGAASVLAGMIQLDGGVVALPGEEDSKAAFVDIYAIIKGAQYALHTALAQEGEGHAMKFMIPTQYNDCTVIGVVKKPSSLSCDFLEIPASVIDEHRVRHGGHYELEVDRRGEDYRVKDARLPKIKTFTTRL
jgi:hypothetical protein